MAGFDAGSIHADVELDATPFKRGLADLKREGERFAQNKFSPKIDADDSEARRKINAIKLELASLSGTTRVNVDVGGNVTEQFDAIQAKRAELDSRDITMTVTLNRYGVVMNQLRTLTRSVSRLDGRTISMDVDVDTVAARARLRQLQVQMDALRHSPPIPVPVPSPGGGDGDGSNGNNNGPAGGGASGGGAGRLMNLAAAGAAAVAALSPVVTVLAGVTAGLASMAAVGGGAAAVFGGALMGAIKQYQTISKEVTKANTNLETQKKALAGLTPGTAAYAAQLQKVKDAEKAVADAQAKMTPSMKVFDKAVQGLKSSWAAMVKETSPATLGAITPAVQGVTAMVKKMGPVVRAIAPLVAGVSNSFKNWAEGSGGTRFMDFLRVKGVPILADLIQVGRNVALTAGNLVKAFTPMGTSIAQSLATASAKMRDWSDKGGFARFLDKVNKMAPSVKDFFRALGGAAGNLGKAMQDLGPLAFLTASGLLKIVAALPPGVLATLIGLFILFRAAMVANNIVTLVSSRRMALLRNNTIAHTVSVVAHSVATAVSTAAQWLWNTAISVGTTAMRLARIAIFATAGAMRALSLAMLTSPIGIVIIALVALVAAFVLLWNKCAGFRNFWKGLWEGIKNVSATVWNWLKDHWKLVVNIIVGVIFGPLGAALFYIITHWQQVKNAVGAVWNWLKDHWKIFVNVFLGIVFGPFGAALFYIITHWQQVKSAVGAVWNWLLQHVFKPIASFFYRNIPDAAGKMRDYVRNAWSSMSGHIRSAFDWVNRIVFQPIGRFFTKTIPGWAGKMRDFVRNAWKSAVGHIKNAFDWVNQKVFQPMGRVFTKTIPGWADKFAHLMKDAWGKAVGFIKTAWDKIKKIAADPINFVIGTVYNKGIRGVWNTIAGAVGLDKLKLGKAKEVTFAQGGSHAGRVSGAGTGSSDSVAARYGAGEHVLTAPEVQGLGGHTAVARLRSQALGGAPVRRMVGERKMAFADGGGASPVRFDDGGGIWGAVKRGVKRGTKAVVGAGKAVVNAGKSVLGKGMDILKDLVRGSIGLVANPLLDKIKGVIGSGIKGKSGYSGLIRGVATKPIDWIKDWISKDDEAHSGNGAGYAPFRGWQAGDEKRVTYGGHTVDARTAAMLRMAAKLAGYGTWDVYQGSFNQGVGASAGTHDGGGVVDVGPPSNNNVGALRASGFAAWARSPSEGFSPHIHAVAVGDKLLSPAAAEQVKQFFAGQNGLADHGPDTYNPPGGKGGSASRYSSTILSVLKQLGESPSNLGNVIKAMNKESGGNPRAINNWDSNAKAGHPSKGLMQVIDSTFSAYAGPHKSAGIYDPEANIYAAVNYARHTYGSSWGARMARPGGYKVGTSNALAGLHMVAEDGPELVMKPGLKAFRGGETVKTAKETAGILGAGGGGDTVYVPTTLVVQLDDKNSFRMSVVDVIDDTMGGVDRSK